MSVVKNKNGRGILLAMVHAIQQNKQLLGDVDGLIGDGDHGIGMATGFKNVLKDLPGAKLENAEDAFCEVGNILLDTMGGASGVLFGTMFISGIVKRAPSPTIDLRGFAEIFRPAEDSF